MCGRQLWLQRKHSSGYGLNGCQCRLTSLCTAHEVAAFMLRAPDTVNRRSSPWVAYAKAVYRGDPPLPLALRSFELFYPGLLPVMPCVGAKLACMPRVFVARAVRTGCACWRACRAYTPGHVCRTVRAMRAVPGRAAWHGKARPARHAQHGMPGTHTRHAPTVSRVPPCIRTRAALWLGLQLLAAMQQRQACTGIPRVPFSATLLRRPSRPPCHLVVRIM